MDDLTVATIDRLIELAPAATFEIDGYTYIDKDKTATLFKPPVPVATTVRTLTGFVDLMEAKIEAYKPGDVLVHVTAFNQVELAARESDRFGRRQNLIVATVLAPEPAFKFNHFMPQEDFNIALRSMFVETVELNELVRLAGNLVKIQDVRQKDDGFTQQVQVKAGVVLVKDEVIKPRVELQPFRTFLEVDQPKGDFIFRVRNDERQGNLCALFEADGGQWRNSAMATVKAWLGNRLKGSSVKGLGDIPVIA